MGDDDAQYRQTLQHVGLNLLPGLARGRVVDAAVHHGPAIALEGRVLRVGLLVTQQPQVDVVQRKRQAHAQPEHAWRHLGGLAGGRQMITQRVIQRGAGIWAVHGFRLAFAN